MPSESLEWCKCLTSKKRLINVKKQEYIAVIHTGWFTNLDTSKAMKE